jgi:hypothetical protein
MTMTAIDLGDGRRLELEPARDVLHLNPAVAGAQLELRVRAGIQGGPAGSIDPITLRLSALVYVSAARN